MKNVSLPLVTYLLLLFYSHTIYSRCMLILFIKAKKNNNNHRKTDRKTENGMGFMNIILLYFYYVIRIHLHAYTYILMKDRFVSFHFLFEHRIKYTYFTSFIYNVNVLHFNVAIKVSFFMEISHQVTRREEDARAFKQ